MRVIHYLVTVTALFLGVNIGGFTQHNPDKNLKTGYQGSIPAEQQAIKDLLKFFRNPALKINQSNVEQIEQKVQKLAILISKQYKKQGLTLREQRALPEARLVGKWLQQVGKFKRQAAKAVLDKQMANLKRMEELVHLIEIKRLMTQEMKTVRMNGGRWKGWSTKVKNLYESLQKKGLVNTEFRHYYEALNQ